MEWNRQSPDVPTTIGQIRIEFVSESDTPTIPEGTFLVEIRDETNNPIRAVRGDLAPHLTPEEVTAIRNFMVDIRDRAENELLP